MTSKWGISFGEIGHQQVLGKITKLLGPKPGPFAHSLEIGSGTGYFSLNLLQTGVIAAATCTDISPGMLATLEHNAAELGLDVETAACDASELPFEDETFDLVLGHAVLHHLPDLDRCFAEFFRVLKPGGTLFFAGEPSRTGDKVAARIPSARRSRPRRCGGERSRRARRRRMRAPTRTSTRWKPSSTCTRSSPVDLETHCAGAGFADVRVQGEELLANWFGWFNRTLEASAEPKDIPWGWIQYAYRGYLLLQRVDRTLLEPRLPPRIFYNLMLAARKPE